MGQFVKNGVVEAELHTLKVTIDGIGIAADHNFVTAANQNEQPIDLGAILPALARVVDIFIHTEAVFTGAVTLVADVGLTTGADDFIASASIYATNALLVAAANSAIINPPAIAATHVWVNATPGANWSNVNAGLLSVYITYITVANA